jgi:hypothetical protein
MPPELTSTYYLLVLQSTGRAMSGVKGRSAQTFGQGYRIRRRPYDLVQMAHSPILAA